MRNFDHPYLATGPSDFWRRWHISLSTWFRDYVYIPLGGSRAGEWATARNLFVTFVVSGLWHGASWNFVMWGAYHGALVIVARALPRPHLPRVLLRTLLPVRVVGTFALVLLGWLMFRETDTAALWRALTLLPVDVPAAEWRIGGYRALLALVYALPLWVDSVWHAYVAPHFVRRDEAGTWSMAGLIGRAVLIALAVAAIAVFRSRQSLDFIYFQF